MNSNEDKNKRAYRLFIKNEKRRKLDQAKKYAKKDPKPYKRNKSIDFSFD